MYGVRAPSLLASLERPDGDGTLWLEDAPGDPATSRPLDRHIAHAWRLGRAQGGAGSAVEGPWLSGRFLRHHLGGAGPGTRHFGSAGPDAHGLGGSAPDPHHLDRATPATHLLDET